MLASAATHLFKARALPCRLSPYVLMSDPDRLPDIEAAARQLPKGAALIYRHFGAPDRDEIAMSLRQICFEKDVQFLVGKDIALAASSGADGVHLPERELEKTTALRLCYPDWIISGAAHSLEALKMAHSINVDAAIVSSVFESQSPSAGTSLSMDTFSKWAKQVDLPIFALGGIHHGNANLLKESGAAGLAGVSGFALS